MMIFIMIAAIIVGSIAAFILISRFLKPLSTIGKELHEISSTGDLSKRSSVKSNDEIGIMAKSLNEMLDSITAPVTGLAETVDAIASGNKNAVVDDNVLKQNNAIGTLGNSFNEMVRQINDKDKIDASFLHGIPDPAFKTNKDLIITDHNRAFRDLMGYDEEEINGNMGCAEVCKTPVCNTTKCTIKKCMESKSTVIEETFATNKSGEKIPIRTASGCLLDSNRKPVGGFEVFTDLTALKSVTTSLEKVAKGDLTIYVDETYKKRDDSTGTLARAVDKMATNVKSLVSNVKKSVDLLSESAEKLSSTSQEVNASAEETTSSVQQIANGANKASEQTTTVINEIKTAEEAAKQGQVAAASISSRMDTIKTTTVDGSNKISSLGEKSKDIGNIVNTINQISEQTNLLALNAAIEAARAGEAGRGFAVVADEVRKLAEESGQATNQIAELIRDIQSEIDGAVKSMEENTKSVDEGGNDIQSAVDAFGRLPPVIEAISRAAGEVSAIAQQNAASSEETSAANEEVTASISSVTNAAQELSDLSLELQNQISKFNIGESIEPEKDLQTDTKEQNIKEIEK